MLVYDGQLERVIDYSAMALVTSSSAKSSTAVNSHLYRPLTINRRHTGGSIGKTEDAVVEIQHHDSSSNSKLIRPTAWTRIPCAHCPLMDNQLCTTALGLGPVTPATCQYYDRWLHVHNDDELF